MLKQGLFQFIYFTYLHNQFALGLVVALLIVLYLLLQKPRKSLVYFFLSFLLLLFHFEYQKHIVQDLAEQTIATLFLTEGYYRGRWLVQVFIYHLIPLLLWLGGWGSLIIALIFSTKEKK